MAGYIPELAQRSGDHFAVSVASLDAQQVAFGDSQLRFSLQSIAKVLSLVLLARYKPAELRRRVGVEPSGGAFNSLIQLETDQGIPRNPFINAGALVVCDMLLSVCTDPLGELLALTRELSGASDANFDPEVAASELATGYRNEALVQFMRSFGNIEHPLQDLMQLYCRICALELTTTELARAFLFLANGGVDPHSGKRILSVRDAKRVNALMQTCGFYDEAGEFAFRVGLPGKSGVGGGIVAVHPGLYTIAVWSPRLGSKGNSYAGMRFLEAWTSALNRSVF